MTAEQSTRPFWMTEADPKWCNANHNPAAQVMDRTCWGESETLPLSFMPGVGREDYEPEGLMVNLHREWREVDPHINVGWIQGSMENWDMTLDEAERLAFMLTRLVDAARDKTLDADNTDEATRRGQGWRPDFQGQPPGGAES